MASKKNEVAGGGRSSKELDKKPIWLEWSRGVPVAYSGRDLYPASLAEHHHSVASGPVNLVCR